MLLRSISFPVSLHSVTTDPAEHALFVGGADGRIFEVSLAGQPPAARDPMALPAAAAGGSSGAEADSTGSWTAREGHARTVTCLSCTTDGAHILSGWYLLQGF